MGGWLTVNDFFTVIHVQSAALLFTIDDQKSKFGSVCKVIHDNDDQFLKLRIVLRLVTTHCNFAR